MVNTAPAPTMMTPKKIVKGKPISAPAPTMNVNSPYAAIGTKLNK